MTIYLYNGQGTSPTSIIQTLFTLKKFLSCTIQIKTIGAVEIISGKWITDAQALIMPGGGDRHYCRALNGTGNSMIIKYVKQGGYYLGICAGAYYGAQQIQFALGSDHEITGQRELAFFPGKAIGPTLASYDYQSNKGARAAHLNWNKPENLLLKDNRFTAFFNGGCHFVAQPWPPQVNILASYEAQSHSAQKACIIEMPVGKGRALLSGVHIEYDPDILDQEDPFIQSIWNDLIRYEESRQKIMKYVLDQLI